MAALTTLNTLTLGNTFGGWYARTNEMIQRLNLLKTASITGGDGILVKENSNLGGFTAEIASTIAKNVTFQGNLTVLGSLNAAFSQNVSGINVILPYNSGVTLGNIVYLDSSGLLQKAKADDECTAEVVGVVIGFTGGQAQVATSGKISGSSVIGNFLGSAGATLQKGVVYFLSEGVTGAGTTLEPSVVDYVSKPVLLGLTGDTGLILPYRGFIATYGLSGGSSTTTVPGVSAGVSSINSLAARVLKATSGVVNNNVNRLKTTGDVFAVTTVNGLSKITTQEIGLLTRSAVSKNSSQNSFNRDQFFSNSYENDPDSFGTITKTYEFSISPSPSTLIYSTSGLTSDVWRIKQIKVTTIKPQKYNSTVEMVRVINRNSVSNYVNYLSACDGAAEVGGTCMLKVGMKAVSIFGPTTTNQTSATITDINGAIAQHQPYSSGQIAFTPVIVTPYKTNYSVSRPTGDGLTAGVHSSGDSATTTFLTRIAPDNSGYHAIIYGDESYTCGDFSYYSSYAQIHRIYVWDVNPTSIGGSNDVLANQYLVSSLEGADVNVTAPTGATLDTSILGWNATYGAVPESLFINLPLITNFPENINGNYISDDYSYNIIVTLKKYDLNSNTESDLIVINKDLRTDSILQMKLKGFDTQPYTYSNP